MPARARTFRRLKASAHPLSLPGYLLCSALLCSTRSRVDRITSPCSLRSQLLLSAQTPRAGCNDRDRHSRVCSADADSSCVLPAALTNHCASTTQFVRRAGSLLSPLAVFNRCFHLGFARFLRRPRLIPFHLIWSCHSSFGSSSSAPSLNLSPNMSLLRSPSFSIFFSVSARQSTPCRSSRQSAVPSPSPPMTSASLFERQCVTTPMRQHSHTCCDCKLLSRPTLLGL